MSGRKRRKLEDHFTTINDDCINEILSQLKLDDLCAISRTCKKLQTLAVREFQLKYPEKKICILEKDLPSSGSTDEKSVCLSPNENYVKCFRRYIKNVYVNLSNCKLNLDLVAFMRTHINQFPKSIGFHRGHFYITRSFAEGIKCILENVESVIFSGCYGKQVNFYNEILKHCKRLKYLYIEPSYHTHHDQLAPKLPLNEHPCLELFQCIFKDKEMTETFGEFLELNSTVKRLACTFGKQLSNVEITKCFQVVAENSKNLNEVYFAIEQEDPSFNLTLIENELKVLSDSDPILRCELSLFNNSIVVERIATLAVFTGLKCSGDSLQSIISSDSPFTKLEILLITNVARLTKQIISDLAHLLPNLKILSFEKVLFTEEVKFTDVVAEFVRQSQQLKEIYFFGHTVSPHFEELNIAFLNQEREKLKNACKLTIYLSSYYKDFFKKQSQISPNCESNIVHLAPADKPPELGTFKINV